MKSRTLIVQGMGSDCSTGIGKTERYDCKYKHVSAFTQSITKQSNQITKPNIQTRLAVELKHRLSKSNEFFSRIYFTSSMKITRIHRKCKNHIGKRREMTRNDNKNG